MEPMGRTPKPQTSAPPQIAKRADDLVIESGVPEETTEFCFLVLYVAWVS